MNMNLGPRGVWLLAPAASLLLLGGVLLFRGEEETPERRFRSLPPSAAPRQTAIYVPGPAVRTLPPARPDRVAAAMDAGALRTLYDTYRTALALGNERVAESVRPRLLEQRSAALGIARQEAASAREEADRRIADQVLRTLER